jgi:glutamate-1-semialdehyde 2,1-aminomutase
MEHLAPVGNVYQAGTLSANPLAMVGGLATLEQMTEEAYAKIETQTKKIVELFSNWLKTYNKGEFSKFHVVNYSSLFWITSHNPDNFNDLFQVLLDKGIYLAPNAYEVGFVSLAHTDEVISELKKRLG